MLAIPVIDSTQTVVVLGSTRFAAYTPESVSIANRFVPAITAAFAGDNSYTIESIIRHEHASAAPEYLESISTATELASACGVIATQITKLAGATRVQIGFIEDESGRTLLGFDTEQSDDVLDLTWSSPDEI